MFDLKLMNRNRVSFVFLSIVLPLSLLIAFRFTGVLSEPETPETVMVDAVEWNISRPSNYIIINKWVKNSYSDDVAAMSLRVHVTEYLENSPLWDGFDVLWFRIIVTANSTDGFIHSAIVNFVEADEYAAIDINDGRIELTNLKVISIMDWDWTLGKGSYIRANAINQPGHVHLRDRVAWMFIDQNSVDHKVNVILELTYFDGVTYQMLIMPIQLKVLS